MTYRTAEQAKVHNVEKMGLELGEQYSALWQEVAGLYAKWGEYIELFGKKSSRVDLLNQAAPAFFRMIQDTLWENILLHLARLTDPAKSNGKSNLSICNLINVATDSRTQKSLPPLITDAMEKTRFCRDWRNRHIAHRDLKLAIDGSASPLEPASRRHVGDALSALAAVLNAIDIAYMDSETVFEGVPGQPGGVLSLLYVINDGVRAKRDRGERLKRGKWREADFGPRDL